jgi:hypothetical protein
MVVLMTAFMLYRGFLAPDWLPKSGIVSDLMAAGGLLVIVVGMSRLGALRLFLLGLGLDFSSDLISKWGIYSENPVLLGLSLLVGVERMVCLAAACIVGVRDKIRSA